MRIATTLIPLLLFAEFSFAQSVTPERWQKLESDILSNTYIEDARTELQHIKQVAIENKDDISIARSLYLLMHIADRKTEDSLFFYNSAYIDSTLSATTSPRLRSIMYLIKAKRLMYAQDRRLTRGGTRLFKNVKGASAYYKMSFTQLDSVSNLSFENARAEAAALDEADVSSLLWLSYDPLLFLFKPRFSDIVFAEQLFSLRTRNELITSAETLNWLHLSPDEFLSANDSIVGYYIKDRRVFSLYKNWAASHAGNDPGAYYYIETLARRSFYNNTETDTLVVNSYEKYLQAGLLSPYSPVKVNAIFQLAVLWTENRAPLYNRSVQADDRDGYFYNTGCFDSAYRLYNVRVLNMMDKNQALLDSFPFIKQRLSQIKKTMMRPGVEWSMEQEQLPGEPILSFLKYRNTHQLHVRIVRVGINEHINTDKRFAYFKRRSAFRDTVYTLPFSEDYQWHNTYLKLDALPAGRYIIFYADDLLQSQEETGSAELKVSNISVLNNDHRVFVLHRKTGKPLTGAKVITEDKTLKVNSSGFVTIKDLDDDIRVINGNDSLDLLLNDDDPDLPNMLYNKEDYDDLMEYYEDKVAVRFFTDRSIYRPGQTVYYKGIMTIPDARTGEMKVLNWKNLRFPFFKKLLYKLAVKFNKKRIEIRILDAFGKEIKLAKVLPDKFGSFSGSFILQKNAALGEWNFDSDDIDVSYENNNSFRVEEYKRPSFEVSLQQPVGDLRLGNNFSVGVKIRSFAGAALDNIRVKYIVWASGYMPRAGTKYATRRDTISSEIASTDANGELIIPVRDSSTLAAFVFDDEMEWDMTYHIEVLAVDNTGESQEADTDINLSSRPVRIRVPMASIIDRAGPRDYYILTTSAFAGELKKRVEVTVEKLPRRTPKAKGNTWPDVDTWIHAKNELERWFADWDFDGSSIKNEDVDSVVFSKVLNTGGNEKLRLPVDKMLPGLYVMNIKCVEQGRIIGTSFKNFTVIDTTHKIAPEGVRDFHCMSANSADPGTQVAFYSTSAGREIFSIYHLNYLEQVGKKMVVKNKYDMLYQPAGLNTWNFVIPAKAKGRVTVTHQYILNNQLHFNQEFVYLNNPAIETAEIVVEKYRTVLKPGEKEVFQVSVRTKNLHTAAQLMTTMYDASLDKLEPHSWKVSPDRMDYRINTNWTNRITYKSVSRLPWRDSYSDTDPVIKPVWWAPGIAVSKSDSIGLIRGSMEFSTTLQGRVAGLNIAGPQALQDVVVVGYGAAKKMSVTGSIATITVRGISSLSAYNSTLVILDGNVFEGDISKLDVNSITEGVILKGADATAIYGSKASNGVLLLSTKGPVQIPDLTPKPVAVRKNFSETAFFYPKLLADRQGNFTVRFTLPESVTEWKWMLMAHTKDAAFVYAEKTIVSQLPLMIQPDMPRFLYQGDKLVLKSRISNMDTSRQSGIVRCSIEDLVTGDNVSATWLRSDQQPFVAGPKTNAIAAFHLSVPDTMLHPVRIRITAAGEGFADGEEHIIPLLSKKVLVAQAVPLSLGEIARPALPADAQPYGVAAFIQPQRHAALLNALPFLANYRFNCTEQTFNKILAHAIAIKMMRTSVPLQEAYNERAAAAVVDPVSADSLAEGRAESMPWLQLEFANDQHQRRLFKLLDTLSAGKLMADYFTVIKGNQQRDGGMSWFKDGSSDVYISLYLLAGLGKMKRDSLPLTGNGKADQNTYDALLKQLIGYCDNKLNEQARDFGLVQWLYARSFWIKENPPSLLLKQRIDSTIGKLLSRASQIPPDDRAMLISAVMRIEPAGSNFYTNALAVLGSLKQQAINDENGIRWKILADEDDLTVLSEERLVKIAEAFEESGENSAIVNGMITWLLKTKQDHGWSTTKSTGDAVALLNRNNAIAKQSSVVASAEAGSFKLTVSDDLVGGKAYDFHNLSGRAFPSTIRITSPSKDSLNGVLNYYYFSDHPPVTENGPVLKKTLYRYNRSKGGWENFKNEDTLHIGDKVRVVLTVETSRRLQYVFINDGRAAAFEPADALSGYQYSSGFSYYRSVADEGFRFFASNIPAGASSLEYEMIVAREGTFSNGVTALECMYQPGIKAWSGNFVVNVKGE